MSHDSEPAPAPDLSSPTRLLEPGARVGRFSVEALLGAGGMGEVYRAWDSTLERSVALKALHPGDERESGGAERFRREALALAQLNHPNICQVHDWVDTPHATFIAMELVEGCTLDVAAPTLKMRSRLQVIRLVAAALEAAHAKGVVHRDLKPRNIMVAMGQEEQEPKVKVVDFGLARLADPQGPAEPQHTTGAALNLAQIQARSEARGNEATVRQSPGGAPREVSGSHSWDRLTQAGAFMGSPSYASPEQIQGQAAGASSDIFSLGIVAWELLSGEHPFPGEGRERMLAIVQGQRKEMRGRGLPAGMSELLRAMLEAHPFKRPTAARVSEVLARLLRPRSALRWASITVLATALLAVAGNWFLSRGAIADLTRQHPARLAVLPFINATGDPRLDSIAKVILPEMLEASLRENPKLMPIGLEGLSRTQTALRLDPLASTDQARLAKALGAQLILSGTLSKTAGGTIALAYTLTDTSGRSRQAGQVQETGERGTIALPLARKAASGLLKAVDPFASSSRRALPDVPPPALEAYARGMELMDRGDFRNAAPAFEAATQAAPDFTPAVLGYARCLSRLAGSPPEPVLQWARWSARAQGNRFYEMKALHHMAVRFGERGLWQASDQAAREALELAKALGELAFEADIHTTLGVNLQRQHKVPEAEAAYLKALALNQSVGDRHNATRVLNNLAVIEKGRGNLKGAEARYLNALETVQAYGDRWGESFITNNLGDLALAQEGGLDRAEAFFRKARTLRDTIGDEHGLAYTLLGLASVAQAKGDLGGAEAFERQFLEQARKTQQAPLEALAIYNLGELSRTAQDFAAARSFYRQSLALHEGLKDEVMEAHCLAGEAECLAREGRKGMARSLLERSQLLSAEETPYILRAQAWVALGEGRKEAARALFLKAQGKARTDAPEILRELKEALR